MPHALLVRHEFADPSALADALAARIGADLNAGLAARGSALLAVSGGSTPRLFFERLGARNDIDWSGVTITLVDERWVPASSDRSNAALVQKHLMRGPASAARFVPLFSGGHTPTPSAVAQTAGRLQPFLSAPFDAVVLGMGNDGHTASFFPGADNLEQALNSTAPVIAISAPGAGEPRITLTLPTLLNCAHLYLHIQGEEKQATLNRALQGDDISAMPIRAVLQRHAAELNLFWCP